MSGRPNCFRGAGPVSRRSAPTTGGLRLFCDYLVDPRYGWAERCIDLFGTHPVQVCYEWNTLPHLIDQEARPGVRPLTREEIQRLFDHADDQVQLARQSGRK